MVYPLAICLFKLANDDPCGAKRLPMPNPLKYQDKIELLAIARNFFKLALFSPQLDVKDSLTNNGGLRPWNI